MQNSKLSMSQHILPTAANLLGLCFVILSFIKFWTRGGIETVVDELIGIAIVLFLISSILSYISMRSTKNTDLLERIADGVFLGGLIFLTIISVILVSCVVV